MIASATGFARDEGFCVSLFKLNMLHNNKINRPFEKSYVYIIIIYMYVYLNHDYKLLGL